MPSWFQLLVLFFCASLVTSNNPCLQGTFYSGSQVSLFPLGCSSAEPHWASTDGKKSHKLLLILKPGSMKTIWCPTSCSRKDRKSWNCRIDGVGKDLSEHWVQPFTHCFHHCCQPSLLLIQPLTECSHQLSSPLFSKLHMHRSYFISHPIPDFKLPNFSSSHSLTSIRTVHTLQYLYKFCICTVVPQ